MFFKTKPVTIEAIKFTEDCELPAWVHNFMVKTEKSVKVHGAQGWVDVELGDWLIKEPEGKGCYPCKPSIFQNKYQELPKL